MAQMPLVGAQSHVAAMGHRTVINLPVAPGAAYKAQSIPAVQIAFTNADSRLAQQRLQLVPLLRSVLTLWLPIFVFAVIPLTAPPLPHDVLVLEPSDSSLCEVSMDKNVPDKGLRSAWYVAPTVAVYQSSICTPVNRSHITTCSVITSVILAMLKANVRMSFASLRTGLIGSLNEYEAHEQVKTKGPVVVAEKKGPLAVAEKHNTRRTHTHWRRNQWMHFNQAHACQWCGFPSAQVGDSCSGTDRSSNDSAWQMQSCAFTQCMYAAAFSVSQAEYMGQNPGLVSQLARGL